MSGFHALVLGLQSLHSGHFHVNSIQNYNARLVPAARVTLRPAAGGQAG